MSMYFWIFAGLLMLGAGAVGAAQAVGVIFAVVCVGQVVIILANILDVRDERK